MFDDIELSISAQTASQIINEEEENDNLFTLDNEGSMRIDAGYEGRSNRASLPSKASENYPIASRFWTIFHVYLKRYKNFVTSPKVHFIFDAVFFTFFLLLFSYFMLCEFTLFKEEDDDFSGRNVSVILQSNTTRIHTDQTKTISKPSRIEFVLLFWIISLLVEEMRQFVFSETDSKIKNKLFRYFQDNWNYIDLFGCVSFLCGFSLRVLAFFSSSETLFTLARIIYVIDLSAWYVRLLHVSIIFRALGPKLVMIQKMFYDLMFFILLISVFVCSFGITTQ